MLLDLPNQVELIDDIVTFLLGKHGQNWVDSMAFFQDVVQELLRFSTDKNDYYRFWDEGCFPYTVCFMTFSVVPPARIIRIIQLEFSSKLCVEQDLYVEFWLTERIIRPKNSNYLSKNWSYNQRTLFVVILKLLNGAIIKIIETIIGQGF